MSGLPNFERNEDHEWQVNERVYVLEDNRYDIFEAIIKAVHEDMYDVHYPEWEDDDQTVEADRLIQITDRNRAIFEKQEKIRAAKDAGNDDDFSDDFEDDEEEKPAKKKRAKAPKEKPEKKPKEPKPKKEKKPKEPKPKKEKKPAEKKKTKLPKSLSDDVILHRALVGVKSIDEFDNWFDKHYGSEPAVQDRRDAIRERFIKRKSATSGDSFIADDNFGESIGNWSESDYSAASESEEEISYNNPEILRLEPPHYKHVDGSCLRFPGSLSFANPEDDEVKEMDMRIMFDEDDDANCFIYKTANEEFLIINGMKWRLKHDKDIYVDQSELFEESPVMNIENPQTAAVLYPALHIIDPVQVIQPPEYEEYLMLVQKEKKKVQIGSMAEVVPINTGTDKKSSRMVPQKKKLDLSRIEYSDDD